MIPDAALIRDEIARFDRGGGGRGKKLERFFFEKMLPEKQNFGRRNDRDGRKRSSYSPYGELRRLPD